MIDKGLEVIVDPLTYRLPYPEASNRKLKSKLNYKIRAFFDAPRVIRDMQEIVKRTLKLQQQSSILMLPYFAIETLEDQFIGITKSNLEGGTYWG